MCSLWGSALSPEDSEAARREAMGEEQTFQQNLVSHVSESPWKWIPRPQSDHNGALATYQRPTHGVSGSKIFLWLQSPVLFSYKVWSLKRKNICLKSLSELVAELELIKNALNLSPGPFYQTPVGIFSIIKRVFINSSTHTYWTPIMYQLVWQVPGFLRTSKAEIVPAIKRLGVFWWMQTVNK